MKIFKFGGASISSLERIQNLPGILSGSEGQPMLIVVSAMGKTTNALEKVAGAFYAGKKEEALELFRQVKVVHDDLVKYLLVRNALETGRRLNDLYTEVEWLLHDNPVRAFDYYYDQIVCIGELLSTTIISAYLAESGIGNTWLDVRDLFRTDDNFRDANIEPEVTAAQVQGILKPMLEAGDIVVTQGFIGATDENESTTLGREGSDYSAAVFANLLDAESLTIWKDVEGVMNADPKAFPTAGIMPELNYDEVIEMAYYGAQVIHPKTIKPLQNKGIPLYVRCFLDPARPGTVIHNSKVRELPPIIVVKKEQALLRLHTKDFSFVGETPMITLYELFIRLHIRPNLMQTGAVSILLCLDDREDKIQQLALALSDMFNVDVEKGYTLLTVRHPQKGLVEGMAEGKKIRLMQQTPETVQLLLGSG
jgi:aspartate kinase